ncbi:MAG: DUF1285 domain-containing protein [Methyloligella sp. ZOD6]
MADEMADENGQDAAEALKEMRGGAAPKTGRPEPAFCGDIGMKIARDGTWYYQESPIGRMALAKLFATVLRKEEDGVHYLVTPVEKVSVAVEDSPFVAVTMTVAGEGAAQSLTFRTNLDDEVTADEDHPLSFRPESDGSFTPFVTVRGALTARIARSVFYDLVELAVEEDGALGVWSGGTFFPFPESD